MNDTKTLIAYDDAEVIIGFINSNGELEYTRYWAKDGGVLPEFSLSKGMQHLAEEYNIGADIQEITDVSTT